MLSDSDFRIQAMAEVTNASSSWVECTAITPRMARLLSVLNGSCHCPESPSAPASRTRCRSRDERCTWLSLSFTISSTSSITSEASWVRLSASASLLAVSLRAARRSQNPRSKLSRFLATASGKEPEARAAVRWSISSSRATTSATPRPWDGMARGGPA
ncbi:hypothetical protein F751_5906 [Auxenochlorella protothecoides]|uniref:Uncharacterized protein n=1 Tax=Auxenochlorella protothecoides TaxID=3075 RepID=A0A087SMX0_AUXPR|nr:hypothetical protein F751_5906 [Auxenochlorella protothecoides]KFM27074.1 hypothetical protein F751_5906 [Auxenochlorella protothecoides]